MRCNVNRCLRRPGRKPAPLACPLRSIGWCATDSTATACVHITTATLDGRPTKATDNMSGEHSFMANSVPAAPPPLAAQPSNGTPWVLLSRVQRKTY